MECWVGDLLFLDAVVYLVQSHPPIIIVGSLNIGHQAPSLEVLVR